MRKITQRLFANPVCTVESSFDPLRSLAKRCLQVEMDLTKSTSNQMQNTKLPIEILEKTFKTANDLFNSVTSGNNLPKGEALRIAEMYFKQAESIVHGIEECGYTGLNESERIILSKAYSSLVNFQYQVGSAKEREDIQEKIDRALMLDPKNFEAENYRLELGINYVRPTPKK